PARRSGLAAESGALEDQRVEPLRCAVDRGRKAGGTGAPHVQRDFLARRQLAPDTERAQRLASRRVLQLDTAWEPDEWRLRSVRRLRVLPAEGKAVGAREVQHLHR